MTWAYVIIGVVALQRIGELVYSARNGEALRARGAIEVGAGHYPILIAVHVAWFFAMFASVDADISLARRLYGLMRDAPLLDVQYRPFLVGVRSTDPMVDYLPSTVESLRGTIVDRNLMSEAALATALADCRAHLCRPDVVFTTYMVAQVWGRTP